MAKTKKGAVLEGPKPLPKPAPKALSLEQRVSELEGDLLRLAELLGKTFGEPLRGEALAIAAKKQGS